MPTNRSLPCAEVAGEPERRPAAVQIVAIVVVFVFVAWMINRGFNPYTAVVTALAAALVVMPHRVITVASIMLAKLAVIARALSAGAS